jgi:hypothetical protein
MAKERRATLQPVPGQPSQSTGSVPSAAAEQPPAAPNPPKRGRSGTGLYVEVPRQMKVELDVVAAILQIPLNLLVAAVLSEYVTRDRIAELEQLAENYRARRAD